MGKNPVTFNSRSVKPAFGRLSLVPTKTGASRRQTRAAVVIVVSLEILWIILFIVIDNI